MEIDVNAILRGLWAITPSTFNLFGGFLLASFILMPEEKWDEKLSFLKKRFHTEELDYFANRRPYLFTLICLVGILQCVLVGKILEWITGYPAGAQGSPIWSTIAYCASLAFAGCTLPYLLHRLLYWLFDYIDHDKWRERRLGWFGASFLLLGYAIDVGQTLYS